MRFWFPMQEYTDRRTVERRHFIGIAPCTGLRHARTHQREQCRHRHTRIGNFLSRRGHAHRAVYNRHDQRQRDQGTEIRMQMDDRLDAVAQDIPRDQHGEYRHDNQREIEILRCVRIGDRLGNREIPNRRTRQIQREQGQNSNRDRTASCRARNALPLLESFFRAFRNTGLFLLLASAPRDPALKSGFFLPGRRSCLRCFLRRSHLLLRLLSAVVLRRFLRLYHRIIVRRIRPIQRFRFCGRMPPGHLIISAILRLFALV